MTTNYIVLLALVSALALGATHQVYVALQQMDILSGSGFSLTDPDFNAHWIGADGADLDK